MSLGDIDVPNIDERSKTQPLLSAIEEDVQLPNELNAVTEKDFADLKEPKNPKVLKVSCTEPGDLHASKSVKKRKGGMLINTARGVVVSAPSEAKVKIWWTLLAWFGSFYKAVKTLAKGTMKKDIRETYGLRFSWMVSVYAFGLRGLGNSAFGGVLLPYFRALGVQGSQFQLALVVAKTPWSMKGWLGMMSDVVPICGYHKRYYMIIACILGLCGYSWMLVMFAELSSPLAQWGLWGLAGAAFLCNVHIASVDLLVEAKYSELMRDADQDESDEEVARLEKKAEVNHVKANPGDSNSDDEEEDASSAILALIWGCTNSGSFLGALLFGLIVQGGAAAAVGSQLTAMVSFTVPFTLVMIALLFSGFLPEERSSGTIQLDKWRAHYQLFMLAIAIAFSALVLAGTAAMISSNKVRLAVIVGISLSLVALAFVVMPRRLALANLYLFIVTSTHLDLGGPLGYFYTAGPECVAGGPEFSYRFYTSVASAVGAVSGILGAALFQSYMSAWAYRRVFQVTTLLHVGASLSDLVIVKRWNRTYLGISDMITYLFGDAAIQPVVSMLVMMPQGLLNSKLCPEGSEATVFAILAGFQNFGSNVAAVLGVAYTEYLGIRAGTADCDFDQLPLAIVVGHCVLPLIAIPLSIFLIPPNRMDEALDLDPSE